MTSNELVGENLEEEQLLEAFVGVLHTTTKMKKSLVALQRNKKKEEGRQYEVVPWFVGLNVRCNKTRKIRRFLVNKEQERTCVFYYNTTRVKERRQRGTVYRYRDTQGRKRSAEI